ncbi:MAG: thioredoxin family protein [Phycisphaerales bacterium]
MRTTAALFLTAMALATPVAAQQDPTPVTPQPAAKKVEVYNEAADAKADIAAAVAAAKKDNKRVLIQWGANWCHWCVKLDGTLKADKKLSKEMLYEYVLVKVDVGRFDKNTELFNGYGAKLKESGIPYLTVLDGDGKVIANQESGALEQGEAHDVGKVLGFLKAHEATPLKADDLLASSLTKAREQGKSVFVHFGAPWCGWCHRLEAWMAEPSNAAILAKDFIDCKVDTDRNPGGGEMHRKYNAMIDKPSGGGIPWFVFLNAEGVALVDSNGPQGNTGFPSAPEEIAHFTAMLRKAKKNMTDDDIAALEKSLANASKKGAH